MRKLKTETWVALARSAYPRAFQISSLGVREERALRDKATAAHWDKGALVLAGDRWRVAVK